MKAIAKKARHGNGTADVDAEGLARRLRNKIRGEVRFDDGSADHLFPTGAAVVRPLRGGKTARWPAERSAVLEERVLLLDTEHRLLIGV